MALKPCLLDLWFINNNSSAPHSMDKSGDSQECAFITSSRWCCYILSTWEPLTLVSALWVAHSNPMESFLTIPMPYYSQTNEIQAFRYDPGKDV
jgi:hypothetical protein